MNINLFKAVVISILSILSLFLVGCTGTNYIIGNEIDKSNSSLVSYDIKDNNIVGYFVKVSLNDGNTYEGIIDKIQAGEYMILELSPKPGPNHKPQTISLNYSDIISIERVDKPRIARFVLVPIGLVTDFTLLLYLIALSSITPMY